MESFLENFLQISILGRCSTCVWLCRVGVVYINLAGVGRIYCQAEELKPQDPAP